MECKKCGLEKQDFMIGRPGWCRDCKREYDRQYYASTKEQRRKAAKEKRARTAKANRTKILAHYQKNPCTDCGETNPIVLEFDHLKDKSHNISDMVNSFSWKRISEEIAKCEVVCANCHRIRTHKRRGVAQLG